jgi:hypothetical protein
MSEELAVTKQALAECERIIERGMQSFIEVAAALMKVRDERLYRVDYKTFDEYCRKRWRWRRGWADEQIRASGIVHELTGITVKPENPWQVRPLATLPPEERQAAWELAVEHSKTGQPTSREVEDVVREYRDIHSYRSKEEIKALKELAAAKRAAADAERVQLHRRTVFYTLIDALKFLAYFRMDPTALWEGIWEVPGGENIADYLKAAQGTLAWIESEHPNKKRSQRAILQITPKEGT